ncbi:ceramide glucosyltransferase, putative [Candidatus Koribacter versatilis Ellin345]|uniref:Ceramide glucosyltransferase, putative n=1 Tax=Koribacter versatilis (strain Ellin345) TaxID=204669 RepID=Q1ITS2_KORVE|nr:bacteriohopanetetrol glucosamine biosynthesis glycosyltransferase HpnI [Candidatus Koribacter versatilis]ABF39728.1 ceramide glucosyltransferase, putative [Candidatus Koribacter versatilis Ellin345]
MHYAHLILEALTVIGAVSGTAYYALCLWGAARFIRERRAAQSEAFTPPVSILKPLKGADPSMYEAFRSHCLQDYPEYEIVFGVADLHDPAAQAVERLQQEFPELTIKLVQCSPSGGTNRKVATLQEMLPHARYPYLLINDSDIRVGTNYLHEVMGPMLDSKVGMVTALYRAAPGKTLGSKLEAIGIGTDFMGGVLSAREIEGGLHFALGSTLTFPREALEKIGGFAPLLDYLADDYELGARISQAGYQVALARTIVETHLPDYSWPAFWKHQLRWNRTIRDKRKGGYFGVLLTFGLPWALLTVIASLGAGWAWMLFLAVVVARYALALTLMGPILHDRRGTGNLSLVPLRDCVAMVLWFWTYLGDEIEWRGETFRLRDGKLIRIE